MYYLLAMYPFGTAVVELARVNFDGSRFGFLTAAFHNLFEYGMILFLFADYKTAKKVRSCFSTLECMFNKLLLL